ncbi:MAG: hypothetical protein J7K32_02280, partial [Deltaproteobacteria bacterium]|nr:hypothetical protein [Deltaproteobacteria bacterium]
MLIDWFTVLAQIVNFLILIFLLKRFLYGPITRAMEERKKKIATAIEQADSAEKKARQHSEELAMEKQNYLETKEQKLAEVRKEIREKQDKSLKEARLEVENLRQTWMDQLTEDKAAFLHKLKSEITSQVMRIGEKVLRDLANEKLERQIITVFLKKVSKDDFFQSQTISGKLLIQSGFKLDNEQSDFIRKQLSEYFLGAQTIQFQVIEKIGIGIRIKAGDRKVEWNLANYLGGLEKEIFSNLFIE